MVKKTKNTKRKKEAVSKGANAKSTHAINAPLHNSVLMSWVAPAYVTHVKGKLWYVVAVTSLVGILWYSLMSGSWSTAVVFILFAGVYIMNMQHDPIDLTAAITELGVQHGTQFYPFGKIKGYWVVYNPPQVKVLHLKLTGKKEEIAIELGDESPVAIRNLLSREIPEIEGKGEPFINYITRVLKL